ncbi:hypothetical protein BJF93_09015 [Xaviernesmea oryzae]|uniref:Aminotransferase class I/classII large domain-containing protein n=1 Tax=Xaviernesmea oryzae TaxID=464029 RepID=A0A1Q9B3Q6_9HYPH|nr:PLP-dependent aminotransferase family protein [Xaviernesmea oryzae]OLP62679.1 hypothetical protein BJF93_09015 [Xaviernesmea oryzae]SEM36231.1 DNA-binding transcriptional regulator, MocR family, contains an aminotransferase domain [Xaviernesmea oryzae]
MLQFQNVATTIDLSRALPPVPAELETALSLTLKAMAGSNAVSSSIRQNRFSGHAIDRHHAAQWLKRRLTQAPNKDRVIVSNGTQSLLGLLFYERIGRGEVLLAETLTYPVLCSLARRFDIRVEPVAIDTEGLVPEALEEACRRFRPKGLFCNPTVHNPTTAIMGSRRRQDIVEVARRFDLVVIEDDVLGALHVAAPPPLASFAPDIVWYIQSLSKCISLGLKIAYLAAPSQEAATALVQSAASHSFWFPSALAADVATRLISEGRADAIADAIMEQIRNRQRLAQRVLHDVVFLSQPGGLHIWLPLPSRWSAPDFTAAAKAQGILVREAGMFAVDKDGDTPAAVRIALTTPDTDQQLEVGLASLRKLAS